MTLEVDTTLLHNRQINESKFKGLNRTAHISHSIILHCAVANEAVNDLNMKRTPQP